MNTSAVENGNPQGGAPVVPPATPPNNEAPAQPPVTPPEGAAPPNPGTPPAAAPGTPNTQRPDSFAGSNWPNSAKEKVRRQSGKIRDLSETVTQQQEYIKQLEEKQGKLVLPKRDQYGSDEEFVQAVMSYNAQSTGLTIERERANGDLKKTEGEVSRAGQEAGQAKVDAARERFPDWDTVVSTSRIPIGQHLAYALHMASNGPEMGYILNKMPQEAARLNALPWQDALQEFSALEAKFAATHRPAPPPGPSVPPNPPIAPVGGGALPATSKQKEWEAQRNATKGLF